MVANLGQLGSYSQKSPTWTKFHYARSWRNYLFTEYFTEPNIDCAGTNVRMRSGGRGGGLSTFLPPVLWP